MKWLEIAFEWHTIGEPLAHVLVAHLTDELFIHRIRKGKLNEIFMAIVRVVANTEREKWTVQASNVNNFCGQRAGSSYSWLQRAKERKNISMPL